MVRNRLCTNLSNYNFFNSVIYKCDVFLNIIYNTAFVTLKSMEKMAEKSIFFNSLVPVARDIFQSFFHLFYYELILLLIKAKLWSY